MSLLLSGTNGLSDVDGSASTPAVRGTDTNTGIFFPAADTIAFAEGGAEVARFDSSGNLGIGTSSPTNKLEVNGIVKLTPVTYSSTPSSSYGGFLQGVNDGAFRVDSYNPTGNSYLAFGTNASSAAIVERMRIASNGALGFSGANYGSSGQVLTSNGSGSAPSWQDSQAPTTFGAIGTYVVAFGADNTGYATGATIAGSSLTYRNAGSAGGFSFANNGGSYETMYHQAAGTFSSLGLSGTWRCMSGSGGGSPGSGWRVLHLWVRVS